MKTPNWWHTARARFRPPASRKEAGMFALQRGRLKNGLRLWVKPRPATGTVMLLLQVPVGSRHETKKDNGISHFLEHMLFTGTKRWNELEVVEVIRRRGGESNARTAREDTVYWLHLKAEDLELGLDWLAEVVFRPTLSAEKFAKERQVIFQEKGGEIGALEQVEEWIEDLGLGSNVFRAVRHRLYPKSSLLLPVIGDDRSLRRIKYEHLLEFYQRHYQINNMTLVVVGDVTEAQVRAGAERYLGGFEAGPLPPRPSTPPAMPSGFSLRLRGPNVNDQGQILLGAPLPGMNHPDRWALGVLAEILDNVLTQDIRYKRGLVYGIDVYQALYTDVGYFVVYTVADSARFPEILAEVEAQIGRALRGELDAKTVAEAKSAIRGRLLLGMESNADFAWWLAGMSLIVGEGQGQVVPNLFEMVDKVQAADVARVARDYLSPEKRYQAIHHPGLTPASLRRPALITAGLAAMGVGAWWLRRKARGKAGDAGGKPEV